MVDLVSYVSGIIDLEIVEKLFILQRADSQIYVVSATRLDDTSDFMIHSKVLDKEYCYTEKTFMNELRKFEAKNLKVTTKFSEQHYDDCPYKSKMWFVEKN